MPGYTFYDIVHICVRNALSKFSILLGKTDFGCETQRIKAKSQFDDLLMMLTCHGKHEDETYHPLLKEKEPEILKQVEEQHARYNAQIDALKSHFERLIDKSLSEAQRIEQWYRFYLAYNLFFGDYQKHLHFEETTLMTALQKHYSDSVLQEIMLKNHRNFSAGELVEMVDHTLDDIPVHLKNRYLEEIKMDHPDKFKEIWANVSGSLSPAERSLLARSLNISPY